MAASDTVHAGELTHKILVWTDSLQRIPIWVMTAIFFVAAWVVASTWPDNTRWLAVVFFVLAEFNALALILLPVFNMSHGPDRAASLCISVFQCPVMPSSGTWRVRRSARSAVEG